MKPIHSLFCLSLLVFAAYVTKAQGSYDIQDKCAGNALYYFVTGATVEATHPADDEAMPWKGYRKPSRHLIIPPAVMEDSVLFRVTAIAPSAFQGCDKIRELTIPASVTAIGDSAFADCKRLKTITCLSPVPPRLGSDVFRQVDIGGTLYVPQGAAPAYMAAQGWRLFDVIMER